MPQVGLSKSSHPQRMKVLSRVLAIVMVLCAGGYLFWRLVPSAATTAKQADRLDANGEYQQSYPKLKSAYTRAISNSDKVTILSRLSPVAENLGKHDEALGYYIELNQLEPHQAPTLLDLGNVAMEQGRKDVALPAYQEALNLEKAAPDGPRKQNGIIALTGLISQLEKQ
jgi:tetratricopeptide (TPR) repeat protein